MHELTRQLRYVLAAAREGSISAAAEAESISTSSILLAIDKLETRYKKQIFVRLKSKGLRLTADGRAMIKTISRFINEFEQLEEDLLGSEASISGDLRVGIRTTLSVVFGPQIRHELSCSHPGLSIRMFEGCTQQVRDDLRNGRVDIALSYDSYTDNGIDVVPLLSTSPYLVLSEADPLACENRVSVEALADRPLFIVDTPESVGHTMRSLALQGIYPESLQRTAQYEGVRSAAALGLGVGILHVRPAIDLTYSGKPVTCRPILEELEAPNLCLMKRSGERLSKKAQAFEDYCTLFFRSDEAKAHSVA